MAETWNAAIRDTAVTFTTVEKPLAVLRHMIAGQPTWVAEIDGRVVGFATYGDFRTGPGYARCAEHSIYVASSLQRRGTGRALLEALQDGAKREGIDTLIAAIGGEAEASRAFHIRMGFAQVGCLPGVGQKFGRRHDLILMQKTL